MWLGKPVLELVFRINLFWGGTNQLGNNELNNRLIFKVTRCRACRYLNN